MSDLPLTRFARRAAARQCLACGMRVPDKDELCPGCGYHRTRELVGGWEPPGPPSDDDSETEAIIERIEELPLGVVASSRDLAHLLRLALPSEARVYGWWSRDGQESLVAWAWDRGCALPTCPATRTGRQTPQTSRLRRSTTMSGRLAACRS